MHYFIAKNKILCDRKAHCFTAKSSVLYESKASYFIAKNKILCDRKAHCFTTKSSVLYESKAYYFIAKNSNVCECKARRFITKNKTVCEIVKTSALFFRGKQQVKRSIDLSTQSKILTRHVTLYISRWRMS